MDTIYLYKLNVIKIVYISISLTVPLVIITPQILQDCFLEANYETTHIQTIRKYLSEHNVTVPTKILNSSFIAMTKTHTLKIFILLIKKESFTHSCLFRNFLK